MEQDQVKVELTFPQKLRRAADFFEEHPELPNPGLYSLSLVPVFSVEGLATAARLAASIPGSRKEYTTAYAQVMIPIPQISEYFELQFYISRNAVCEPVETVTEVIPEHTEQRVTKWKCQPLLGLDKIINSNKALDIDGEIE